MLALVRGRHLPQRPDGFSNPAPRFARLPAVRFAIGLSEDVSGVVQAADEDRTVISVLICDDHRLLTDTLTTVIENDASLRMLTPPVHSSEEAVDLVRDRRPDVV